MEEEKMRKMPFFAVLLAFVVILFSANANAEKYEMGAGVSLQVDYIHFMDSVIGDLKAQNGVYVGVEAYKNFFSPNFYLGVGVGMAGASGRLSGIALGVDTLDTDISYVPIEFNAKYVFPLSPCWNLGLGGGFSINYLDVSIEASRLGSISNNDWLWGGQFFAELNYKYRNWAFGLNVKYQLTEEVHLFRYDPGVSADNLRAGGQVSFNF
jgi:hypothetical protein